jgi:hypothetical protein
VLEAYWSKTFWVSFGNRIGVTRYFGHPDDDYISMCSGSQYDLLPEKRNLFPPLQDAFLEGRRGMLPLHIVEIPYFCRLHYSQPTGLPQAAI